MIEALKIREYLLNELLNRDKSRYHRYLDLTIRVMGRVGLKWLVAIVLSTLLLSAVEYFISIFLQVLLTSLGMFDAEQIPAIIRPLAELSVLEISLILVLIGILRSIGQFYTNYSPIVFSNIVSLRLRKALFENMTSPTVGLAQSNSYIMTAISENFPKASIFIRLSSTTVLLAMQAFFLLLGMLYLGWRETILTSTGLLIIAWLVKITQRRIFERAAQLPKVQKTMMGDLDRVSRTWSFIQINRMERDESERLTRSAETYNHHVDKMYLLSQLINVIPQCLGIGIIAATISYSHYNLDTGPARLLAFLYLFIRFVQMLNSLIKSYNQSLAQLPQYIQALNFYDVETSRVKIPRVKPEKSSGKPPAISLEEVSYKWPKAPGPVLSKFSMAIAPGEILGIKGKSGAGKSTLLKLITGILDPDKGKVAINGEPARLYLDRHCQDLGYVGPEHFLFDGTIRENLLYGMREDEVSEEDLWQALRDANVEEKVRSLPKTLNTKYYNHTDKFSSGEKQRLSLARAFIRKPTLLVLDEATANLDLNSEGQIRQALAAWRDRATIIIVSHRDRFLEQCDRVIDMNNRPH